MARRRLYAKRTASAEYEQLDLFGILEEERKQADRTAEQVRCVLSSCYRPVWREFSFRKSGRF